VPIILFGKNSKLRISHYNNTYKLVSFRTNMATPVNICTFNVQNLFARYKKFVKIPGEKGNKYVPSIKELKEKGGFLPSQQWKSAFAPYKKENKKFTALSLFNEDIEKPDIVFLQEVESMDILRKFNDEFLGKEFQEKGKYRYQIIIDSDDPRRIDVAVLSDYPIKSIVTHMYDTYIDDSGTERKSFSRDCLEISFQISKRKTLTAFVNHLKSKYGDDQEKNDKKRKRQAEKVATIVKERFNGKKFIKKDFVIVGDFNDAPSSDPVKPLVKDLGVTNVINKLPKKERWTYLYRAENTISQIDYLLLSPNLVKKSDGVPYIERRGLPKRRKGESYWEKKGGELIKVDLERFPDVSSKVYASDHCPVFFTLNI